jgi:hypothetical protein
MNRLENSYEFFIINKLVNIILLGKAPVSFLLMFTTPSVEIICDTGIKNIVVFVRKDVDIKDPMPLGEK